MILYKKEPFPLQMKNIMLIDDPTTGGCVYLSKQTYDQAIILHNRLDGDPKRVLNMLLGPKFMNYGSIPGMTKALNFAMENMPEPINCLAPFLLYCIDNKGIDWENITIETVYGILHMFSQLVDFNAITLVPVEVRANMSLPTAIVLQYKVAWDDLCSSLKDKVVMTTTKNVKVEEENTVKVSPKKEAAPTASVPDEDEDDEDDEDDDGIDWDALNARLEAIKNAPAENGSVPEPKPAPTPTPTPAPAPVTTNSDLVQKKNEAAAANAILNEFDY